MKCGTSGKPFFSMDCLDKHAPLRHKQTGKKHSPWISSDLLSKMRQRNFLKKKAEQKGDPVSWTAFKKARNSVNAAIKVAKRDYFTKNLEKSKGNIRKTWQLINELGSRNQKSTDIQELKVQGSSISVSIPETRPCLFSCSSLLRINIHIASFMQICDR